MARTEASSSAGVAAGRRAAATLSMDGGADDHGDADDDGAEEDGQRNVLVAAELVPDVDLRREQVEQDEADDEDGQADAGEDHGVEDVVPAEGEGGVHG